jgi:hypothetical protein
MTEKPMTFLTAQPVADSGVKSNQLNAGVEFRFPEVSAIEAAARSTLPDLFTRRSAVPAFLTTKAGGR